MSGNKYYWLKLKKDFFKRHDMKIVEAMPNGKDYILFYLKLLCESLDHNGSLRFSDLVPYNETMLSAITNTNVDIVRSAVKIFTELGMMKVLDDGTIFMNEVHKMLGSETEWAEKKRLYRAKNQQSEDIVPSMSDKSIEIRDKKLDLKKTLTNVSAKESRFTPPSLEEVTRYKNERHSPVDPEAFIDFYQSKGWMVGKNKMKDWKAAFRNWERDRKPSSQSKKTAAEYNYEGYKALYEKEFGHDQRTDNEVLSISESDFHITET